MDNNEKNTVQEEKAAEAPVKKKMGRPRKTPEQKAAEKAANAKKKRPAEIVKSLADVPDEEAYAYLESIPESEIKFSKHHKGTYDPSDIRQTLTIMMDFQRMSKTKVKTPEQLMERWNQYIDYCAEISFKPTVESLAVACGVDRATLNGWKIGTFGNAEMHTTAKQIFEMLAAIDADMAINGKMDRVVWIFRAKNYHDMHDQSEVTVSQGNTLGEIISVEDIEKKYAELPED